MAGKTQAEVDAADKESKTNKGRDADEKAIEKDRINLHIPTPDEYSSKSKRDALYRLNKQNAEKDMSASDLAAQEATRRGLPGYKKGGRVKKTGLALVHKGERVLTKSQAKSGSSRKMISYKR